MGFGRGLGFGKLLDKLSGKGSGKGYGQLASEEAHPYGGCQAVLSTQHGKEKALQTAFGDPLGLKLVVPPDLDTDRLGTFTGEIPRKGHPLDAVRRKVKLGMKLTGLPYGLASEGSFGPHRMFPWVTEHQELLHWRDDRLKLEWTEAYAGTDTNYTSVAIRDPVELGEDFLNRARFPSHALIVRPEGGRQGDGIEKGITSSVSLEDAIRQAVRRSPDRLARVETDMRAHMNPTRMAVLGELGKRLAARLATRCPRCDAPGWGVVRVERGLPCERCGEPTDEVALEVEGCLRCRHRHTVPRRDGRRHSSAAVCPACNP